MRRTQPSTKRPKFLQQPMSICYNGYMVNNNNIPFHMWWNRNFSPPPWKCWRWDRRAWTRHSSQVRAVIKLCFTWRREFDRRGGVKLNYSLFQFGQTKKYFRTVKYILIRVLKKFVEDYRRLQLNLVSWLRRISSVTPYPYTYTVWPLKHFLNTLIYQQCHLWQLCKRKQEQRITTRIRPRRQI